MFEKHKELVVNLLIIVATLAIVWNVWSYFKPSNANGNAPAIESEFRTTEFNPAGAQVNALIFLRTGCNFCDKSMPFYRRIAQFSNTGKVKVAAIFDHNDLEASEYMERSHLVGVGINMEDFNSLGIKGTPTFVEPFDKWLSQARNT